MPGIDLQSTIRSAFVVVNGIQLIQCTLPTMSEGTCAVCNDAVDNLRVSNDFGCLELTCVFYASSDVSTQSERPWIGELIIDDNYTMYLGQLPGGEKGSVTVSHWVISYPRTLEFRLTHQQKEFYRHPEEALLVEEIQALLRDERLFPGGGCVPHTSIQSRVEKLECYKRIVTEHYKGKWFSFLSQQQGSIVLVPLPGEETRVGLLGDTRPPRTGPSQADTEEALLTAVVQILESGDHTYVELLQKLEKVKAFSDRLNPSQRILFRFLQSHSDIFWVKLDPLHTTRVGLVRG
jgi:hypothetical protein